MESQEEPSKSRKMACETADVLSVTNHLKNLTTSPSVMSVSILVSTLVEELCSFYEHDQYRKEILFHVVCDQLVEMSLLSPLAYLDELAAIRARYRETFIKIMDLGQEMATKQAGRLKNLNIPLTKGAGNGYPLRRATSALTTSSQTQDHFVVMPSRYQEEFEELHLIGHGGFGRVYQSRHRVDGQEYAVKKIQLPRKSSRENILKIFREVKVLAGLHHKHVVGYNAAWLELDNDSGWTSSSKNGTTSHRPDSMNLSKALSAPFDCSSYSQLRPRTAYPIADSIAKELEKQKSHRKQEDDSMDDSIVFVRTDSEQDMASKLLSNSSPEASRPIPPPSATSSRPRHQSENAKKRAKPLAVNDGDGLMQFPTTMQFQTATISQTPVVLFIQMELCGKTLRDWMRDRNAGCLGTDGNLLPEESVVDVVECNRILKHVLKGIEYIHSKGLIHRDLKPRNIFFHMQDNRVMIGDFGLARKDLITGQDDSPEPSLRRLSAGVGTVTYSSPEQLHGTAYDLKSDMFSLGIVMVELLSPFITEMERAISLTSLRAGKLCPQVSLRYPAHARVIQRLLQTDPKERPLAREILSSDIFINKDQIIQALSQQLAQQQTELITLQALLAERTFPGASE